MKFVSIRSEVALYTVSVGKTADGKFLDDKTCYRILCLPINERNSIDTPREYWIRSSTGNSKYHPLDKLIDKDNYIRIYKENSNSIIADEIERLNLRANRKKSKLEHSLDDVKKEIKKAKEKSDKNGNDRLAVLKIIKEVKKLEKIKIKRTQTNENKCNKRRLH